MSARRGACCAAVLSLALALPCTAQLPAGYQLRVSMRDNGYVLGDLMEQRLSLDLPTDAKLEAESVPGQGRVNHWLELRERSIEKSAGHYEIRLVYQVFGAVENALPLSIPGFRLRLRQGAQTHLAEVAPQPFYLSPVLPAVLRDEDREPRPSLPPTPVPEQPLMLAALLSLLCATLLAAFLAWCYDLLPFLPRSPGPLTHLFRRLRRLPKSELAAPAGPDLLQEVLTAFNLSAHETLYADTLGRLFERVPALLPLREPIQRLFDDSWQRLYGVAVPQSSWSTADVVELCRAARDCERGLR